MRPPLQMVCTTKKQKKMYKLTKLRGKELLFSSLYFICLCSFQFGLICWPQTWVYCQYVARILRKYKCPQLRFYLFQATPTSPKLLNPVTTESPLSILLRSWWWSHVIFHTKCLILDADALAAQFSEPWILSCVFCLTWEVSSCLEERQIPPLEACHSNSVHLVLWVTHTCSLRRLLGTEKLSVFLHSFTYLWERKGEPVPFRGPLPVHTFLCFWRASANSHWIYSLPPPLATCCSLSGTVHIGERQHRILHHGYCNWLFHLPQQDCPPSWLSTNH